MKSSPGKDDGNDPAQKLAAALKGFDPSSMQEALRRPGSVDFAVMIAKLQEVQNAAQGPPPETTPEFVQSQGVVKLGKEAEEAPSEKSIRQVLPPTRPSSPAPPPVVELPENSPMDIEDAAKSIEVGYMYTYTLSTL